jgi:hypothetical protein
MRQSPASHNTALWQTPAQRGGLGACSRQVRLRSAQLLAGERCSCGGLLAAAAASRRDLPLLPRHHI